MGGELGNETYIDLLVYSALSTKFVIRGYLGEIESEKKGYNFSYTFFFAHSVVSGLVLPIFVAQFAVVHEIQL